MEAGVELIERVRLVCGARHVLTDPVELSAYRSDGIRRDGPLPLAVALPGDTAEVVGVVTACADAQLGWVVRGAGTSTGGGALPRAGELLISLTRMRRIIAVDLDDEDELTVEPGVPSAAVERAVSPTHSFPATGAGTVGGAVAQGTLAAHLAGLEIVQDDGTLARISPRTPGYNLTGAFSGSEGKRGIAVAITLRAVRTR